MIKYILYSISQKFLKTIAIERKNLSMFIKKEILNEIAQPFQIIFKENNLSCIFREHTQLSWETTSQNHATRV